MVSVVVVDGISCGGRMVSVVVVGWYQLWWLGWYQLGWWW